MYNLLQIDQGKNGGKVLNIKMRVALISDLLKHVRIFFNEIIEYDILSGEPACFYKKIIIQIIDNIRYPLI